MDFMNYIVDQALILIPVLYIIGNFLKNSIINNRYIPLTLLVISVILSMLMIGFTVEGFIQGVLVAGAAVFSNEFIKQINK